MVNVPPGPVDNGVPWTPPEQGVQPTPGGVGGMQSQVTNPNQSQFIQMANKFGLAKVPTTLEELFAALQQIMTPHEFDLVKYLYMQPEQYQASSPFGSPDQPVAAAPAPAKDNAPAQVTVPTPVDTTQAGGTVATGTPVNPNPVPTTTAPYVPPVPQVPRDANGNLIAATNVNPTKYNPNVVPGTVADKTIYYDKSFQSAPMDVAANRAATGALGTPGGYSGAGAPVAKPYILPVIK